MIILLAWWMKKIGIAGNRVLFQELSTLPSSRFRIPGYRAAQSIKWSPPSWIISTAEAILTFSFIRSAIKLSFETLGFYEITRVKDKVVFMENKPDGFDSYVQNLQTGYGVQAAIVMNANPFTLGHRWLVEQACRENDTVHLFIVSEDISQFPYAVREKLVREGTADLANIIYHPTKDYLVSTSTFPSYFLKETSDNVQVQAMLDTQIFILLAKRLGITVRYVGEEPISVVTNRYNSVLKENLPCHGITCREIPRLEAGNQVISASRVRALLACNDYDAIKTWYLSVPIAT